MPVIICMLRAVNVGGHNKVPMAELRTLCAGLKLRDAQTYVQSGNVVFKTAERDLDALAKRLQKAIERKLGCCPEVILRTTAEMKNAINRNPFAKRKDIEPNKFLITFLGAEPTPQARAEAMQLEVGREEMKIIGRELYMYFPDGLARPKITWGTVERKLKVPGTARNWNTVNKLLEMAEKLEGSG
jgi:uncharacterized protein (DUF1697 family)